MMRSNSGAARVSVVWIIATIVLALVAVAFAVISQNDLTAAKDTAAAAALKEAEAKVLFESEAEYARQLSRALGFYDRAAASPRTNPDTVRQGFEELRAAFPALDSSVVDFELAVAPLRREYEARGQRIAQVESDVRRLESELATERQGRAADVRSKDTLIAQLRGELADAKSNAADRESELQATVASERSRVSALDQDLRNLRSELEVLQRAHNQELARYSARVDEQGRKLTFLAPGARDLPDAKVLAVSGKLGTAWIDVGAEQRAARGIRFRIEGGSEANRRVKGFGEVVEVEGDRSKIALYDVVDAFDPITAGDVLINPVYDPRGERKAVLAGRFSGQYDEKELRALLSRMGITVQSSLDLTTDFLIAGDEIYVDEFDEPYEQPLQPSDLPVYKEAEALGVQILPISRIREYFVL